MAEPRPWLKKYLNRGQLREVGHVTETRDGCIWKTESLGLVVAKAGYVADAMGSANGSFEMAPSTALMREVGRG